MKDTRRSNSPPPFYQTEVGRETLGKLPEAVQDSLSTLVTEPNLAIKGGVARLVLLQHLIGQRKEIHPFRFRTEQNVKDLDMIIFHKNSLPKEKEELVQRVTELKDSLAGIPIPVQNRDFEAMKGNPGNIKKILNSRDLTINQTVLVPDITKETWHLCYTKNCWRDILRGIGMLTPNGVKLIRYDWGRMLPTNYGFLRLLRFWVEGKVEQIYLPDWWLSTHFKEIDRLHEEGKVPLEFYLGRYSLILVNQYANADWQIKERWMRVLTKLGFTDLYDFDKFAQEQNILLQIRDQIFNFEEERPFGQIIDRIIQEREQRQKARQSRKQGRQECQHQFTTLTCQGCNFFCKIQRCKCGQIIKPTEPRDLPCNWIFKISNWSKNPASLRRFPKKPNQYGGLY